MSLAKPLMVVVALTAIAGMSGCPTSEPPPEGRVETQVVMEVTEVKLAVLESQPPQLQITATGNVPTAGWADAQLRAYTYVQPPPDGIYDYDFFAVPPQGPAASVITPVSATLRLSPMPDGIKGVRIHAERNNMVARLDGEPGKLAYFEFKGAHPQDRFVIKLVQADKIRHARAVLESPDESNRHIAGTVVKEKATYNPGWSYHLAPKSIYFFDVAIEVCDANMRYVEEHLGEVGGAFLPDKRWCPWSSELTQELRNIESH